MRHLVLLILLAGCGSVVPRTAMMLNAMNPLATDPAALAVSVDLPPGLGIIDDSVIFAAEASNPDRGMRSGDWVLFEDRDVEGRPSYRFSDSDAAELRNLQSEIAIWEADDPRGTKGSFSVNIGVCRSVPAATLADARGSLFISMDPDEPPMPLVRNGPINRLVDADTLEVLPPCS
ncbi:MAG: hypothetical protein AAFX45_02175 [Pseudomonadota bacterium]